MKRIAGSFLLFTFLLACSGPKKPELDKLTELQRGDIQELSEKLVKSINDFDFSVVNTSWDNQAFRSRIKGITKTQSSVLNHLFDKDLKPSIKAANLSILYDVNTYKGKATVLKLNHFDTHSELTMLLTFEESFNFLKYRIEHVQSRPVLTDFYTFLDNTWLSQQIIKNLQLSTKYTAFSQERRETNLALTSSNQHLSDGDTISALNYLNEIPQSHQTGNWLSLRKLDLASTLGDSIYSSVLETEYEKNNSLYMQYLYALYYDDFAGLFKVYESLTGEIGESKMVDSLLKSNSAWN